jgi:hypothetical protein
MSEKKKITKKPKNKYGVRKSSLGESLLWLKRKGECVDFGFRHTLCRKVVRLLNLAEKK